MSRKRFFETVKMNASGEKVFRNVEKKWFLEKKTFLVSKFTPVQTAIFHCQLSFPEIWIYNGTFIKAFPLHVYK